MMIQKSETIDGEGKLRQKKKMEMDWAHYKGHGSSKS